MKNAGSQWDYVQQLQRQGHTRAAARQALAFRLFWPYAEEAPMAQLTYARLLEQRGHLLDAFDAYQYLLDHYIGRFDFKNVMESQRRIAREVMEAKRGKFLFLPGFSAPERAIPLLEKIVQSAPEDAGTPEDYYLIGVANDRIYEYEKAINAYFATMNRFPDSDAAEKAAYAQAIAHIKLSDDAPNDKRALDTARAATMLYLQRYPRTENRPYMTAEIERLTDKQAANAFSLALYYDTILKKPESAVLEYQNFLTKFPNDKRSAEARRRIQQLSPRTET
ncbi:MAG: hypothetical protein LBN38_03630 [Verrucomicrobiota bacterium]|jgi:tetratricopeptide (TPR) repeat protein|nr:hypothetical protein [Verrucomicrobiota bacterium]